MIHYNVEYNITVAVFLFVCLYTIAPLKDAPANER